MQQALTNLGLNNNWDQASSGWKAGMDQNLLALDGLVQPNVPTRRLTTPPTGVPAGTRYLIPATGATDVWAAHPNSYTVWSGQAWLFVPPVIGWSIYVVDENRWVTWIGVSWVVRGMRESAHSCRTAASVGGALTLDTSVGEVFDVALTENVTAFSLINAVAAPDVTRIRLRLTQTGSGGFTLVLPSGAKTPGTAGYVPSPAAGAVDLVTLTSFDAGASWYVEAAKAFG